MRQERKMIANLSSHEIEKFHPTSDKDTVAIINSILLLEFHKVPFSRLFPCWHAHHFPFCIQQGIICHLSLSLKAHFS